MKKIFILLGITLPLLFFKLNSFAYENGDLVNRWYEGANNTGVSYYSPDSTFFVCRIVNTGFNDRVAFFSFHTFSMQILNADGSLQRGIPVQYGSSGLYSASYQAQSYNTILNNGVYNSLPSFASESAVVEYLSQAPLEFSFDTSSEDLVYPTGYFRETGSNGSFSNILVLDNKPDNARVLVDYRWHSINDINIQTSFWSRKFDISYNTSVNSTRYNFKEWSDNFTDTVIDLNNTFEDPFLVSFPIEDRTFHYLNKNGQETTLAAISAHSVYYNLYSALESPNSIYNSLDIFVAYAYKVGNTVKVSKWSQFYRDLQGNLNGVSNSDLGFIESGQASLNQYHYVYDMTNEDKNTTSIINDYGNPNAQTVVNNIFDTSQFDTTQTIKNLNQSYQGIFQMVQNVPQMFSQLFSFLPSWVVTLLAVSIGLLVIVGLIKALL